MLQVLRMGMDQHDKEMEEEEECTDVVQPCLHYYLAATKGTNGHILATAPFCKGISKPKKENRYASCRFLEIIPAMMQGKKCTGICTLANVRRMSIHTGEVPLAIASCQFCNLQQFFHAQFCQFASHQIPCLQKPKFLLTVLPWTPLMIQKMVQFAKFSSISPDGKNQQASIGNPDINRWLFLALPTPYP
jgi:hypothetical protein